MSFESLHAKFVRHLPNGLAAFLNGIPFHPLTYYYRQRQRKAIASGPPYYPSHESIIIDITSLCNLNCDDCNRSCGSDQAISDEIFSAEQMKRFISQSIQQKKQWKEIVLEGGEPTLHPFLSDLIDLLLAYKDRHSNRTRIKLLTNGYSSESQKKADELIDKGVVVINSNKQKNSALDHCGFNYAPCDFPEFKTMDFSQGCYLPAMHGLGLTKHGFYPHPVCGGIDRVFGFDIGRKSLPKKGGQNDGPV